MTTTTTTRAAVMTTTDRRRLRLGFRTRVLGSFVALVAGATVVGLLIQRAVLLERLDREIDASLEQERTELEQLAAGNNPSTGQPFEGDVRSIFETFLRRNVPTEGEVYLAFVNAAFYRTTPAPVRLDQDPEWASHFGSLRTGEWGRISTEAGPVRYLAVPLVYDGQAQGVFVVANFVQGERDEISTSFRVEAMVSAGVLVVATGVAWLLAGRLLRPVRQLTETAESISDTDLGRRIPVEGDDEIARLARRFNEMLDRLAASFASQRAFVDDAGHELRTPITIVRGHLELMGEDPDDRRETVALVTEELDRMARIVEDLLLLARAEQPDVQREPVEVAELTTDLLVKARALGARDWRLDACVHGVIHVDRQRVTQAVLNLVRNAVENTTPGTEVAVGSGWGADGVRIWVRDRGPGIDPAERDKIFERFARGGGGARRSDGAGLGLAIVRSVAAAHGGHVELDSRPGAGATFTIVLPATAPAAPAAPAAPPTPATPPTIAPP
ncbi:MAG: sensor histidine kinase, partial [Acidimicrobiales bacterium]